MNSAEIHHQLALVTCSYKPDYERCARLCRSMDAFISEPHFIIVPARDKGLFSSFESPNRTVLTTQDVLPAEFLHLPVLRKWWLDNGLWPIRGWMMQQLTKLCADVVTERENIIFVDSDIEFLSPLQTQRFVRQNALRLHRKPLEKDEGVHLKWHHAAAELLNLRPQYFGSDYIAPLATWRRSNLIALKRHIENSLHRPWHEAVGRRLTVSEYILYGVFVEHVLGMETSNHFQSAGDLCHCLWSEDGTEKFLDGFSSSNPPQAVLLQSNIGLDQKEVNALMGRLRPKSAVPQ